MAQFDTAFVLSKPTKIGEIFSRFAAHRAVKLIRRFGSPTCICELGPGRAYFADECFLRKIDYIGVDCNRRICESMEAVGHRMICSLIPPIPDVGEMDAIFASNFIEHIPQTKVKSFIDEIRSKLPIGGLLFLIAPEVPILGGFFWQTDFSHQFPTSEMSLSNLLGDSDFEVLYSDVKTKGFGWPLNYFLWWISRFLPWRFLRRIYPSGIWRKMHTSFLPCCWIIARKTIIKNE